MYIISEPCPFCKDTLPLTVTIADCECKHHKWVFVECEKCGAQGPHKLLHNDIPQDIIDETETMAIIAWDEGLKK